MRTEQSSRRHSYREFREILENLREQVLSNVRLAIKEGREEGAIESGEVQDVAEVSEADAQSDLEFTWLQMQGATLDRIAEALERLDDGRYGICTDCDGTIPADRLRALPFATRCLECEREHEAEDHDRSNASWRSSIRLLGRAGFTGRPQMRP
jgi:DnaK suppressor protein